MWGCMQLSAVCTKNGRTTFHSSTGGRQSSTGWISQLAYDNHSAASLADGNLENGVASMVLLMMKILRMAPYCFLFEI